MEMHRVSKLKVTELNPHLVCVLCGGYLIDATTIIECLHSFCRTCILRYLESSKYCPVCDVQVHKTKPHQNLRPDKALQNLVYKLVPGVFREEMRRRRTFYSSHPQADIKYTNGNDADEIDPERAICSEEERISVCLQHSTRLPVCVRLKATFQQDKPKECDRRHLLCPAALEISHIKKFLRMKFDLPLTYQVDVFHSDEILKDDYSLMDIAYIYGWRRREPLQLFWIVYELTSYLVPQKESANKLNTPQQNKNNIPKRENRLKRPCVSEQAVDKNENFEPVQPVKRGRGRPCKSKNKVNSPKRAFSPNIPATGKRPVGRPRKIHTSHNVNRVHMKEEHQTDNIEKYEEALPCAKDIKMEVAQDKVDPDGEADLDPLAKIAKKSNSCPGCPAKNPKTKGDTPALLRLVNAARLKFINKKTKDVDSSEKLAIRSSALPVKRRGRKRKHHVVHSEMPDELQDLRPVEEDTEEDNLPLAVLRNMVVLGEAVEIRLSDEQQNGTMMEASSSRECVKKKKSKKKRKSKKSKSEKSRRSHSHSHSHSRSRGHSHGHGHGHSRKSSSKKSGSKKKKKKKSKKGDKENPAASLSTPGAENPAANLSSTIPDRQVTSEELGANSTDKASPAPSESSNNFTPVTEQIVNLSSADEQNNNVEESSASQSENKDTLYNGSIQEEEEGEEEEEEEEEDSTEVSVTSPADENEKDISHSQQDGASLNNVAIENNESLDSGSVNRKDDTPAQLENDESCELPVKEELSLNKEIDNIVEKSETEKDPKFKTETKDSNDFIDFASSGDNREKNPSQPNCEGDEPSGKESKGSCGSESDEASRSKVDGCKTPSLANGFSEESVEQTNQSTPC